MLQVLQAFGNYGGYQHNGVHNVRPQLYKEVAFKLIVKQVADAFTQIFITLAVATAGLRFGIHTSTLLDQMNALPPAPKESKPLQLSTLLLKKQRLIHVLVIGLALLIWLVTILLSVYKRTYRHITFALNLAPLGTWLRYYLSRYNARHPSFPFGTFSANVLATALLSAFTLLQTTSVTQRNPISCAFLQGLDDGFCGCLSTVSTFATEIRGLSRRHAYRYAVVSILVGQAVAALVFGVYWWSHGLQPRCAF